MSITTGWSSSYYQLPPGATELQDLIEHKEMNFAVANIFKAAYRLGSKPGVDAAYDLEKIIWFAQRELARHKNALSRFPFAVAPGPIVPLTEGWPSPRCSSCQTQPCSCIPVTPTGDESDRARVYQAVE